MHSFWSFFSSGDKVSSDISCTALCILSEPCPRAVSIANIFASISASFLKLSKLGDNRLFSNAWFVSLISPSG